MQDSGNLRDALFEHAEGAGIREHEGGNIFGAKLAEMIGINLAARVGFDVFYFVSGNHYGRWIRSVRGIGNQNRLARIALALKIRANHQQAGKLALRAGHGLKRGGIHAGDRQQTFLQVVKNAQAALGNLCGLLGVFGCKTV